MIRTGIPIKVEPSGKVLKVKFSKEFPLVVSFLYSQEFPAWVHIQSQRLGMNPAEFFLRLMGAYRSYCEWVALRN